MPKVNLGRDVLNEEARKFYIYVRSCVSKEKLCKLMGYTPRTDTNRMNIPENLTLKELRVLYREANLPDEVFMRMIREEK